MVFKGIEFCDNTKKDDKGGKSGKRKLTRSNATAFPVKQAKMEDNEDEENGNKTPDEKEEETIKSLTMEQVMEQGRAELSEENEFSLEAMKAVGLDKLREMKGKLDTTITAVREKKYDVEDDWFHTDEERKTPEALEIKEEKHLRLEKLLELLLVKARLYFRAGLELREERMNALEDEAFEKAEAQKKEEDKEKTQDEIDNDDQEEYERTEKIINSMKVFGLEKLDEMAKRFSEETRKTEEAISDLRGNWKSLTEAEHMGREAEQYEAELTNLQKRLMSQTKEEDNVYEAIRRVHDDVKRELFPQ
jgi:hypothetical protein